MELVVGRVAKSHGIRGELVVEVRTGRTRGAFRRRCRTAWPQAAREQAAHIHGGSRPEHSGRLLLRLEGVADRTAADNLRGTLFVIDTADLTPSDDPDEFYDHELEGLTVRMAAPPRCRHSGGHVPRYCILRQGIAVDPPGGADIRRTARPVRHGDRAHRLGGRRPHRDRSAGGLAGPRLRRQPQRE
ncbi:16S rRNA processing protein RimM [Rhodococcus hoagii]|nr:16S rRNA processing protein RimM [Prescottella equi]